MTKKEYIINLYKEGKSLAEVADLVGLTKSCISWHLSKAGVPTRGHLQRKHDWKAIAEFHGNCKSIRKTAEHFNMSASVISAAAARGIINTSREINGDKWFRDNTFPIERADLKRYLIRNQLLSNVCSICAMKPEWNGKTLTLVLDHINGINDDNRLSNLRLVCPNCDSQSDTFKGRNTQIAKSRKLAGKQPRKYKLDVVAPFGHDPKSISYKEIALAT